MTSSPVATGSEDDSTKIGSVLVIPKEWHRHDAIGHPAEMRPESVTVDVIIQDDVYVVRYLCFCGFERRVARDYPTVSA